MSNIKQIPSAQSEQAALPELAVGWPHPATSTPDLNLTTQYVTTPAVFDLGPMPTSGATHCSQYWLQAMAPEAGIGPRANTAGIVSYWVVTIGSGLAGSLYKHESCLRPPRGPSDRCCLLLLSLLGLQQREHSVLWYLATLTCVTTAVNRHRHVAALHHCSPGCQVSRLQPQLIHQGAVKQVGAPA